MAEYFGGVDQYFALKVQVDEDTTITPDTYYGFLEIADNAELGNAPSAEIMGKRGANRLLGGRHVYKADIKLLNDMTSSGHVFNMHHSHSVGSAVNGVYPHTFAEGTGAFYTIDFGVADRVVRFACATGAGYTPGELENDENLLLPFSIQSKYYFSMGKIKTALTSGANTTIDFNLDFSPTVGLALKATDTIQVQQDDGVWTDVPFTGGTITEAGAVTGLTYSTTGACAVGNLARLKKATPSYTDVAPFKADNTLYGIGATEAAATTAAGARSTALGVDKTKVAMTWDPEIVSQGTISGYPAQNKILRGNGKFAVEVAEFYEDGEAVSEWMLRDNIAMTSILTGVDVIGSGSAFATQTFKFNKLGSLSNPSLPASKEEYNENARKYEALQHASDGERFEVLLNNTTATY